MKTFIALALFATIAATRAFAEDAALPAAATKTNVTYAVDIKPIFEKSCNNCHNAAKPRAGLALDSLEGALKGSRDGKVVIPGDAAKSSLFLTVAHVGDPMSFMPKGKDAKKLSDEQIGLIRAWIEQGAK